MDKLFHLWVYLETTPLLGLVATLVAWQLANIVANRFPGAALANPMLISVLILASLQLSTHTPNAA